MPNPKINLNSKTKLPQMCFYSPVTHHAVARVSPKVSCFNPKVHTDRFISPVASFYNQPNFTLSFLLLQQMEIQRNQTLACLASFFFYWTGEHGDPHTVWHTRIWQINSRDETTCRLTIFPGTARRVGELNTQL